MPMSFVGLGASTPVTFTGNIEKPVSTLEAYVQAPSTHRGVTIFSVTAARGPSLQIIPFAQISTPGVVSLRMQGDDAAPLVLVRNLSFYDVLILPGDILSGEVEGRVAARSFLLGGKKVTQVPAVAVDGVSHRTPDTHVRLAQVAEVLSPRDDQIGFLAFRGSRILGLEAVGSPKLYRAVHRCLFTRLFRETASFTPNPASASGPDSFPGIGLEGSDPDLHGLEEEASRFVEGITDAVRVPGPPVGVGSYWELDGAVVGSELIHRNTLIHLSVRPRPGPFGNTGSGRSQPC